ncbi:hypothetical protein [Enterococcus larvae]|uniref:hypothetical protein n=1 Tax=Enterococcus larvae TaxID=2794352 RepID=UPI003F2F047E
MAKYEEDFMLRQAKQMADLLGSFMDKESVAEIMEMDAEQGQKLKMKAHENLLEQLGSQVSQSSRKRERSLIKRRIAE